MRDDLANGFRRIKDETLVHIEQTFGKDEMMQIERRFAQHEDFLRSQYTKAALRGIAKNGITGAAGIARPYLQSADFGVREVALDVMCQFGDASDVDTLIEIAKDSYGETRRKAAKAAQDLSSDSLRLTEALMATAESELTRLALFWLASQKDDRFKTVLATFLHDEKDSSRVLALAAICRGEPPNNLETKLHEYINSGITVRLNVE